ncbi:major facilitator family transporter [Alcanivorax sp. 521-1]|uniref:Major facilitator family transporter n=1 Tax=Alloalcanivorax profundimaris TaxID=2735259 RepID=A0ABS0AWB0_9GAMM|nr:OFA family MFS transporter [Alloalcanivorax profundimaris]MBF5058429.1 major facilitator family transporter [Alloalcanivorax profundimaris]MBM1142153.1 OFA family MFS transporter [Alcanivorax sp. ZXX171]
MDGITEEGARAGAASRPGFFSRERTIAGPRFNRWLVPTAALAIHLCIGMAYGFSVFWLPMSNEIANPPASCGDIGLMQALTTTTCNWTVTQVTYTFGIFIAMLGVSAAIWGAWLEHAGPRKAGFIAALCWGGGMILGGVGVMVHQLWLVYLGAGVLGGVGQGLGYITPVSTLIKWFPDRRGMATGFAIMGYGGGAMIGAPLAVWLMARFSADGGTGVAPTLIAMGVIYAIVMSCGAFGFRVPPNGWKPSGWQPKEEESNAMITEGHVHLNTAWKTKQFWLIWAVLFLNVTAGIAVISMASPMLQEVFGGILVGVDDPSATLTEAQLAAVAAAAAGLVGLISLFNSLGRLFWASLSDKIGRKNTYFCFFVIGIIVYSLLPTWGHLGMAGLFVISICVILSMYGGGFATVPAYLADIFGTQMVGAIHGRLLTAWSAAGLVGPLIIGALRDAQLQAGVDQALVYDRTLYIMAGLLFVGLICNALVRPVHEDHHMDDEEVARERALQHDSGVAANAETAARGSFGVGGVLCWLGVGVPFLIGLYIAIAKAAALF